MPAFAEVRRDRLRLLLAGAQSSAGRPMPNGRRPEPGGWNRIHFVVGDIATEVDRLRTTSVSFRSDVVVGPGGKQIVLDDPSGNPIELFQPAEQAPEARAGDRRGRRDLRSHFGLSRASGHGSA